VSAWTNGTIRLRQGGMGHTFSGKFGSESQIFRKRQKSTTLPQAKYTVIGSRHSEKTIFFHKDLCILQIFVKKDKEVPCCRRRNELPGLSTG
jgi:hypothetical protein